MTLAEELAVHFSVGHVEIQRIIATAPARYKSFEIDKRNGGTRIIAQPSRELKSIQRYIVDRKLSLFQIHPAATGYVIGKNIVQNAEVHRRNRVILKLDFQSFFTSIRVKDWVAYVKNTDLGKPLLSDLRSYSQLLFWGEKSTTPKCLSIGAPSSPILSNILMFDLDVQLNDLSVNRGLSYTRYADDITVSGPTMEGVREFEILARKVVSSTRYPRLAFNDEKRGIYMRGQRRMVTGLIITPVENISIGRERKRLISSMLHHALVNRIDQRTLGKLKGLLGFCLAAEPSFVDRMRAKYGNEVLDRALKFRVPRRIASADQ